jgi:hypothetical protein
MKKDDIVELVSEELKGTKHEFTVEHAENILSDPKNSPKQWAIPQGAKYKFEGGKIVSTTGTGDTRVAAV